MALAPIHLARWVEEHRELLRPPVGNKRIWADLDTIVMLVGGPNARTDFHIDPGEELFYQLEGDIELGVVEDGRHRSITIKEGELFLLPAGIPHSPRRPANTIGLVVERKRLPGELDGLRWYCERCQAQVYEEFFALIDVEAQLKAIIEAYREDEERRTCPSCRHVQPLS